MVITCNIHLLIFIDVDDIEWEKSYNKNLMKSNSFQHINLNQFPKSDQ